MSSLKSCVLLLTILVPAMAFHGCRVEAANLIVATDLHYIAPQLTDNGPIFREINDRGDGKIMLYSEVVTDAFIQEVIDSHPDALILSGDLTFNGAALSHEKLADRLQRVCQEGIPVLVIPGNHDLDNENAARYEGYSFEPVDSEDADGFREHYYSLGPDHADSFAPDSLSYLYSVSDDVKVLMLDTNSVSMNHVSEPTMKWVREVLEDEEKEGVFVISVSHQNLYQHSPLFQKQFQIFESDELAKIYRKYHVIANLSGHMHIQHIVTDNLCPSPAELTVADRVPEIATSSLAVNPLQYGLISITDSLFHYENESVDVGGYLREHKAEFSNLGPKVSLTDPNLQNLRTYALEYLREKPITEVQSEYASQVSNPDDLETMADCFANLNAAYFSGDKIDLASEVEGLKLWNRVESDLTTQYIDSIVRDAENHRGDYHHLTIQCGNRQK